MKKNMNTIRDHHCTVLQESHQVSEMINCDVSHKNYADKYKCYLEVTNESRYNDVCRVS